MSNHHYDDQQSTFSFMQSLRVQPDLLAEVKGGIRELANQADVEQPVEAAIAAEMAEAAAIVATVEADSHEWHALCRSDVANRRDGDRVTDPRKSPAVEGRADVGAAIRDM